jgi:hypothetical protein
MAAAHVVVSFQINEESLAIPKNTKVQIYSADLFTRALQVQLGSGELASAGDTLIGDVQLSLTDAVGAQIDPLKAKAEGMISKVDSVLNAFQQMLNKQTVKRHRQQLQQHPRRVGEPEPHGRGGSTSSWPLKASRSAPLCATWRP